MVKNEKLLCRRYAMALLRPVFRALAKADQTNIKMNEMGVLQMQHSIVSVDSTSTKVGHYVVMGMAMEMVMEILVMVMMVYYIL